MFGHRDELVLLPIGVLLAVKMIPTEILAEHRERSRCHAPRSRAGAAIVITVWVLIAAARWLGWRDLGAGR